MTLAHWPADQCPACLKANSVSLTTNNRLCLDCRHEWDPTHTFGPLASAPMLAGAPDTPDYTIPLAVVPDAPPADPINAARIRYLGKRAVVHEHGAEGDVTAIDDNGRVEVTFGSGFYILCDPDEVSIEEDADIPDDVIEALGAIDLTIAAQVIRAGAQTITATGETRVMGMPPDGWLIPDADMFPVVEHGASYAVAWLAIQFGIATDDLEQIAAGFDTAATAAREASTP